MQDQGLPAPPDRTANRLRGIALMVLAVTMFSCMDATVKFLAAREHMPVAQIVWVRFLGQFLAILAIVPAFRVMRIGALFTSNLPRLQLARSLMMLTTTAFNFLALEYLRLDQTVTIAFLTPLVVALIAGPLLGEWIGWRRAIAALVGFSGILVVVRPGFAAFNPAILYSMASMLAYAVLLLLTRRLAAADPPLVTLFYSLFAGTLLAAPWALTAWVWPRDGLSWLLLASLGVLGGGAHYVLILAHRHAPASIVAPFIYLQLLSMVALGFIVFGDVPDRFTLAGSAIVIASGIYLLNRERLSARTT